MRKIIQVIITLMILSCANEESEEQIEQSLDLTVVEGKYKGIWSWHLGDGLISMVVKPTSYKNIYAVDYYESNNYRPRSQSDGISPDARGQMTIEDEIVRISLGVDIDNPPCTGNFEGLGTINDKAQLVLTMNIDDCFAENVPAEWSLEKKEDL